MKLTVFVVHCWGEINLFQTQAPSSKIYVLLRTMGKSQTQGGAVEQLVEQCHVASADEMFGTCFYKGPSYKMCHTYTVA